jgi:hypothetical protein
MGEIVGLGVKSQNRGKKVRLGVIDWFVINELGGKKSDWVQ